MGEKENYLRVPITMPFDMFEALEDLSLRVKVSGGKKLANTEIVRAFIRFGLGFDVDISGCKSEDELLVRLEGVKE